jgi:ABC-type transport system involved in cytochrome c biogenesis permease subunit
MWRELAAYIGAGLLALGGVLALPAMIPRGTFWRRASRFSAIMGMFICTAVGIVTWVRMGRPPVASGAEMLLLLAPALALAYIVAEGLAKSREAGLPVLLTAAWLAWAGYSGTPHPVVAGELPLPVRSAWLPVYVVGNSLAYGFLFTAGIQAAVLLVVRRFWPRRAERAGRAVYWSVCLGFAFLIWAAMVAGIWSQGVRGSFWSWTSRELWVLVYCLLLAVYLNVHFIAGWRERRAAWFLIAATLVGLCSFASLRELPAAAGDMPASVPYSRRPAGAPANRPGGYEPGHEKG